MPAEELAFAIAISILNKNELFCLLNKTKSPPASTIAIFTGLYPVFF